MEDKDLLTLLIAFVLGYFAHQMMRQMCGGRLMEGSCPECPGGFLVPKGLSGKPASECDCLF